MGLGDGERWDRDPRLDRREVTRLMEAGWGIMDG